MLSPHRMMNVLSRPSCPINMPNSNNTLSRGAFEVVSLEVTTSSGDKTNTPKSEVFAISKSDSKLLFDNSKTPSSHAFTVKRLLRRSCFPRFLAMDKCSDDEPTNMEGFSLGRGTPLARSLKRSASSIAIFFKTCGSESNAENVFSSILNRWESSCAISVALRFCAGSSRDISPTHSFAYLVAMCFPLTTTFTEPIRIKNAPFPKSPCFVMVAPDWKSSAVPLSASLSWIRLSHFCNMRWVPKRLTRKECSMDNFSPHSTWSSWEISDLNTDLSLASIFSPASYLVSSSGLVSSRCFQGQILVNHCNIIALLLLNGQAFSSRHSVPPSGAPTRRNGGTHCGCAPTQCLPGHRRPWACSARVQGIRRECGWTAKCCPRH